MRARLLFIGRVMLLAILAVAAVAAGARRADAQSQSPDDIDRLVSQTVASVSVDVEGQPDTSPMLLSAIDVRRGRPLMLEDVHSSVHHLFILGYVAEVFGAAGSGGVDVVFNLKPFHPVAGLRFEGETGLAPDALDRLVRRRFGTSLSTVTKEAVLEFVKDSLKVEGYLRPDPKATEEETHVPRHTTTIVVDVRAGLQARIGHVEVVGNPAPLSQDDVIKKTGATRGAAYRPNGIDAGLVKVTDKLRSQQRYTATASRLPAEESPDGATVNLTLRVISGPRVEWQFDGPKPPGKMDDYVPIKRESAVDRDLLDDSSRRIEAYWRGQGYKDAKVEQKQDLEADRLLITFTITRGQRFVTGGVRVIGNTALTVPEIETLAGLVPGAPIVVSQLNNADAAIRVAYQLRGYYAAVVTHEEEPAGDAKAAEVTEVVHFTIVEGEKATVTAILFQRSTAILPEAALSDAMKSKLDKPFVPFFRLFDEDNLKSLYANQGFPSADVKVTAVFGGTPAERTLRVDITEGAQVIVGDIRIVGYRKTKPDEIRRALTLRVGQPFSAAARHASEQAVIRMGLFRSVQIAAEPLGTGETRAHIVVTVDEAAATVISYGGGLEAGRRTRTLEGGGNENYSYAAPRGFFEVTRQNFGGVNRSIDLFTRVSASPSTNGQGYGFTEYRFAATYRDRYIFDTNSDFTSRATSEQGIRTDYSYLRQAFSAGVVHPVTAKVQVSGQYTLEYTHLFDSIIPVADQPLIDRLFPQVRLSIFSGSIVFDRRNDGLAPSSGSLLSAGVDLAGRSIGSEVGFVKTLLQASAYHDLTGSKRFVLALRAQTGFANGFPRPVQRTDEAGNSITRIVEDLPANERFYSGGSTTVRGWDLDTLGVPEILDVNGLSTGGNGVVVLNAELRTRIAKLFKRDFGVVTFVDAGNVFARASDVDFGLIRGAVGFGFRYNSPLGPVRLDYGFKLNRLVFKNGQRESGWAWALSIGEAF
jgi:outer membrane protein assembly complex protein YaeT